MPSARSSLRACALRLRADAQSRDTAIGARQRGRDVVAPRRSDGTPRPLRLDSPRQVVCGRTVLDAGRDRARHSGRAARTGIPVRVCRSSTPRRQGERLADGRALSLPSSSSRAMARSRQGDRPAKPQRGTHRCDGLSSRGWPKASFIGGESWQKSGFTPQPYGENNVPAAARLLAHKFFSPPGSPAVRLARPLPTGSHQGRIGRLGTARRTP
jgi:hypothetical protein